MDRPLEFRFEEMGQAHVLAWVDQLEVEEREVLGRQLEGVTPALLTPLVAALESSAAAVGALEPPLLFPLQRSTEQRKEAAAAEEHGRRLQQEGRLGFVLVAGGAGTRLGYHAPKGLFPIGPVSQRSLFEWHCLRIRALSRRVGRQLPLYVMTSADTHEATQQFFEENDWFGLSQDGVTLFRQGHLPVLDAQGRLVMESKSRLLLAANGHGGVFQALSDAGCLDDASARGVDHLFHFQVDNPMVNPLDPLFLGLHDSQGAEMSSKAVAKEQPDEKVGLIALIDGKVGCLEYSDLPSEQAEARDEEGRLRFRAGNVAMHLYRTDFVRRVVENEAWVLPLHLARKQVDGLDEEGSSVALDAVKFETFVFDALQWAERSVTLEIDRSREFCPLKDAEGPNSPDVVRAALAARHVRWLEKAGLPVPPDGSAGFPPVEVSPLYATSAEDFKEAWERDVGVGRAPEIGAGSVLIEAT